MGNERVIFSNRFDRPTLEQIEEEMKNENYDDNENSMTAEEFLDFMRKNRRTVPNEKRIANKDKFIWAVSELSETYEIDADLIEDDDGYRLSFLCCKGEGGKRKGHNAHNSTQKYGSYALSFGFCKIFHFGLTVLS